MELVARLEQDLLSNPQTLSWGHVVALLTFAGTLLERPPPGTYLNLTPDQQQELEWETNVGQDCQHLVALLCNRLTGRHRAWLEAHDGWVRQGKGGYLGCLLTAVVLVGHSVPQCCVPLPLTVSPPNSVFRVLNATG